MEELKRNQHDGRLRATYVLPPLRIMSYINKLRQLSM